MKAVSAHALVVELTRQGIAVGVLGVAAMEGCVETADLRYCRVDIHHKPNGSEIVRLVQRRQFLVGR